MKKTLVTIGFGAMIWAIPFAVGLAIFPIIHMHTPLFDTLVSLAMIVGAVVFSTWYLMTNGGKSRGLMEIAGVGMLWVVIAILIDLPIMVFGPVGMNLHEYVADIGIMYLGIPVILLGIGRAMGRPTE